MKKPHKHAELIKAWADGAIIQWVGAVKHGGEKVWTDIENPDWCSNEYRIKPEPEPDIVMFVYISLGNEHVYKMSEKNSNVKLTFDGETGKLKSAEVLK